MGHVKGSEGRQSGSRFNGKGEGGGDKKRERWRK